MPTRTEEGSAPPGDRVVWADVAKGACIVLVVLWHVVVKDYLRIDWRVGLPVPGAWGLLGEQLLPLRMPLFFAISGIFAANAVARPWRLSGRPRIARNLYLYAVWLLIHTALLALAPGFPTDRATNPGELLAQLTVTPSNLWYLYALALYFVIAKALRRVHPAVLLTAAGVLSAVAATGLLDSPGNRGQVYQNLVFFLAGVHLKPYLTRWADGVSTRRLAAAGAAYGIGLAAMALAGAQSRPGVYLLVSVAAVAFGLTAAARLARHRLAGPALARLGRRTLPVYVIHMPVLALLDRLLAAPVAGLDGPARALLVTVYPVVLTALVLALSLAAHRGLTALGARWLFDLPRRAHSNPEGEIMPRIDAPELPARTHVEEAARVLSGRVVRTPVLHSPAIDRLAGARILLKAENLQDGGSYKMRGAMLAVGRLAAAGHTGVVAQSTGNHAVAVALAARRHGLAATVVLPVDAAPVKVDRARAAGARVVRAGTTVEERLAVARRIAEVEGHPLVDAYDHPDVVAGQGSASLELIEEAARRGTPLDALVVPVGGGGGIAGACLAAAGTPIQVYGVEPVGCDSLARSLAAGRPTPVAPAPSLADGLRPGCVGDLPFAVARTAVRGVVRVDDDAIVEAFRLLLLELKVLVEPSGAAGLAGALRLGEVAGPGGPGGGRQMTVGVVLTGGNVEADLVARLAGDRMTAGVAA
ncbi:MULTISPECIES: pyridoxal-phosphate dependent enzyme [unclassified Micromonospora]|uniref:pyridoxal-phosphate dependent enzyme n=1 Tax=unclassified Micromonospora TaxID=2617518 RepID=UPI001B381ED8|nr:MULTISPECIES: pyridoxal-phosphate dependent enzyme [unclassified Micromonospora]MBQ1044660.1 pyridoxal-phosphate dependent enzyme [Micromonospora sp. C72]MBQ1055647.1 pyridoxal-phosphate dependent enzyme [Micromonospora sp. C32]